MRFQRDLTTDGGGGYTELDSSEELEPYYRMRVLSKHKRAFIRRTVKNGHYSYQVVCRKNIFWFFPIGESHLFKDQCWRSAYYNLFGK